MPRLAAEERKEAIIKAAVALFSQSGFSGTTTRMLARKAGISEALLFRHFPDKKKLYQAILSSKMEEQIPAVLDGLDVDEDPRRLLLELARRIARQNVKDPSFLRLLLFSALEGHELSELFFQRRNLPLVDFLTRAFADGIERKRLRRNDPERVARCFLSLVYGFLQTRILFRIPDVLRLPLDETLEGYVDIFLGGCAR